MTKQKLTRPIILLPTNDPQQHICLMTTAEQQLCPIVRSGGLDLPSYERHIGQRVHWTRAARVAAHERGLKLRGAMCALLWFEEMTEAEQHAIEQDILAVEFGFDAQQFDPPTNLAELRWGGQDATPEQRTAVASSMGRRGGQSRSAAKLDAVRINGQRGGRPMADTILCTCGRTDGTHVSICRISQTEAKRRSRATKKDQK